LCLKTFSYSVRRQLLLQNVTLVISDSDRSDFNGFLETLDETNHPFSDILIMVPTQVEFVSIIPVHSAQVHFVSRDNRPEYTDICHAPIKNTKWFMKLDSFLPLGQVRQLMVHNSTKDAPKPIVMYSKVSPTDCSDFTRCAKEYSLAKMINSSMQKIFVHSHFVYEKDSLSDFCDQWKDHFDEKSPPSATSYIAYLQTIGQAQEFYHFSEQRMKSLLLFLLLLALSFCCCCFSFVALLDIFINR